MTSTLSCEPELICYICQDLLTENPEDGALTTRPPPAKRSRCETLPEDQEEPHPSTSTGSFSSSSASSATSPGDYTPELCSTKCGHIFHKYCLLDWINRKQVCPTCRQKVTRKSLIRVFLPLTAGQCRQCKDRVLQMDEFLVKYCMEKTRAEDCAQKEAECRNISIHLAQENEEIKERLNEEMEKVEELQAEVAAEKVQAKLVKLDMIENKSKSRQKVHQLEQDLRFSQEQLSDKEKLEKALIDKCERINKEKEELKLLLLKREQQENKSTCKCANTIQDWKSLCRLKELKIRKLECDRDYEREKAEVFRALYERIGNGSQDQFNSLEMIINSELGPVKFQTTTSISNTLLDSPNSPVNLVRDLEVSDSEDENISQDNAQKNGTPLKSNMNIMPSFVEMNSYDEFGLSLSSDEENNSDDNEEITAESSSESGSDDSSSDSDSNISE